MYFFLSICYDRVKKYSQKPKNTTDKHNNDNKNNKIDLYLYAQIWQFYPNPPLPSYIWSPPNESHGNGLGRQAVKINNGGRKIALNSTLYYYSVSSLEKSNS